MNYYDLNGMLDIPRSESMAYAQNKKEIEDVDKRLSDHIDDESRIIQGEIQKLTDNVENTAAETQRKLEETALSIKLDMENLDNRVDSKINMVDSKLQNTVDTKIDIVNNRVDNIIANTSETEGNSELVDIRTGNDGNIYETAGTAVRKQFSNIQKALKYVKPDNKFNRDTVTEDYTIYETGTIVPSEGNFTSDFIPCDGGKVFYFCRKVGTSFYNVQGKATVSHFAQYDSNKRYIEGTRQKFVNAVTLDENTKYVRFCNPSSQLQTGDTILSVTFDHEPTSETISEWFEPYWTVETDKINKLENDINKNSGNIENIKSDLEENETNITQLQKMLVLIEPENKLDRGNVKTNTIINISGNEVTNDTCFTTDFIKAKFNDIITFAKKDANVFMHKSINITRVAMYNERKEFLSASELFVQDYPISETKTVFIRLCLPNSALDSDFASVTINNIPTSASIGKYFKPYSSYNGISDEVKGKKRVLWVGTSIPTYGYPQILGRLCGATIINNSIGSSCLAKGVNSKTTEKNICGIRNIYGLYGLCQTIEEKQAMINNWETIASELGSPDTLTDEIEATALSSSYETVIDPYLTGDNAVNLVVINHAYNDSQNEEDTLISDNVFDTKTLEGAYNWLIQHIIQKNPNIGIVIFGHYSDMPEAKETALERAAKRWNIPYYELKNDLGWSNENIMTTKKIGTDGKWVNIPETQMTVKNMWCADNTHPIGLANDRIAQVSKHMFEHWLSMYCPDN